MQKEEIRSYINNALKKVNASVTTDWLHYCIEKNADFEILQDNSFTETVSIKSGIPAIGHVFITDNDFFEIQSDDWKKEFELLKQEDFTVCIDEIIDIKICNLEKEEVNIISQRLIVKFANIN